MAQILGIKDNSIPDLAKDYDLAYKNISGDNFSALLNYKSEYLSNVTTLLSEIDKNDKDGVSLLKQLTNPKYMDNILEQYHQYFANIKFTYLEQSTKERFLANVASSKFISVDNLSSLKDISVANKKRLKLKKTQRDELLVSINKQMKQNCDKYEKIARLQDESLKIIDKSKELLDKIDSLEKENTQYHEETANRFEDDGELLEKLHAFNDFGDVVQETLDDSLVYREQQRRSEDRKDVSCASFESSIVSNFDDYVLINSTKNLHSLVGKRKLAIENAESEKQKITKKMRIGEEKLSNSVKVLENVISREMSIRAQIEKTNAHNALLLQKHGSIADLKKASMWYTQSEQIMQKIDRYRGNFEGVKFRLKFAADSIVFEQIKDSGRGNCTYRVHKSDLTLLTESKDFEGLDNLISWASSKERQ